MPIPNAKPPDLIILDYGEPSEVQEKYIRSWIEHGSANRAATILGVAKSGIVKAASRVQKKAEAAGWSPMFDGTAHVPSTERVIGRSILTKDDQGNTIWLKTKTQAVEDEALVDLVKDLVKGIKPFNKVPTPKKNLEDLCTVYTLTDYHIGAYSWEKETGADWNVDIAEKVLLQGVANMMDGSPDADQAVFVQMGDFLHWDGLVAVTPTGNNVLDADTRYPMLVQVAIRCCVKAVEMMLHKHKKVHVLMCEGNHDLTGSVWLQAIMKIAFKDNDRVTIDGSVFPYYSYVWGKTWLGWHHGHLSRIKQLAAKFYSEPQFRSQMALAKYLYVATGHLHYKEIIEDSGIVIERHPTLNARDAYGARGFQHSQRGALAITYSKERGEVSRVTVVP